MAFPFIAAFWDGLAGGLGRSREIRSVSPSRSLAIRVSFSRASHRAGVPELPQVPH
jgi:hypothetical protein